MDYYKEKYNTALEKLQEALAPCEDGCKISGLTRDCLENIFPELKMDEDERIRKAIIRILKGETGYTSKEDTDKYVAWLEKQGEKVTNINGAEWADEHPHWISVDEELPPTSDKDDESDDYLTVDSDGDKNVGYYNKMDELWFSCDGHILDVTHWMPMLEAPSSSEIPNNCEKGGKE